MKFSFCFKWKVFDLPGGHLDILRWSVYNNYSELGSQYQERAITLTLWVACKVLFWSHCEHDQGGPPDSVFLQTATQPSQEHPRSQSGLKASAELLFNRSLCPSSSSSSLPLPACSLHHSRYQKFALVQWCVQNNRHQIRISKLLPG